MSNDIDFDQFIKLLDGALASDDKNVKQALRKFLFVAAMVMGDDCEPGPFTEMMDTIDSLQERLVRLEKQMNSSTSTWTYPDWTIGTGIGASPTFIPATTGGTSTSGSLTPISGGGSITSSGNTTYTNLTGTTSTITLPNTSTSGTTYSIGATTSNITGTSWYNMADPKTGTSIKEEIKKGLEKLAK